MNKLDNRERLNKLDNPEPGTDGKSMQRDELQASSINCELSKVKDALIEGGNVVRALDLKSERF